MGLGFFSPFCCIVIWGQTHPVQVSAAGRRGSPGSRLAVCLHQQVKGRAGHQFELGQLFPEPGQAVSACPECNNAGLGHGRLQEPRAGLGGTGGTWIKCPAACLELATSPKQNGGCRNHPAPLQPSRGQGMWWGPGSTSLEGGGKVREGLTEPRMSGCNRVGEKGSFALIGRRGWGQELCHTSTRSW